MIEDRGPKIKDRKFRGTTTPTATRTTVRPGRPNRHRLPRMHRERRQRRRCGEDRGHDRGSMIQDQGTRGSRPEDRESRRSRSLVLVPQSSILSILAPLSSILDLRSSLSSFLSILDPLVPLEPRSSILSLMSFLGHRASIASILDPRRSSVLYTRSSILHCTQFCRLSSRAARATARKPAEDQPGHFSGTGTYSILVVRFVRSSTLGPRSVLLSQFH